MKGLYIALLLTMLHNDVAAQNSNWKAAEHLNLSEPDSAAQVSTYITHMHQDRKGNIWFGTNGDGVCRYDGKTLAYFNEAEGFGATGVRDIIEDENGDLWFATTGGGVTRFDGKHFTNYTAAD